MRVAIIAEIHGNKLALEVVLEDLSHQPAVDQLVIAGDLCLNGPCPREVLDTVQKLNCPVIQGNVDLEVVNEAPEKGAKKRTTVAWTREQIGKTGIAYLASLPPSHLVANPAGSDLLIVHANPLNLEDAIFPNAPDSTLAYLLGSIEPTVGALDVGHLHIAYTRHLRYLLLAGVASCGQPRHVQFRDTYGLTTWQMS